MSLDTSLVDDRWRAVDDPFALPPDWRGRLAGGICTNCGKDAFRGRTRWWHIETWLNGPGCWGADQHNAQRPMGKPRRPSTFSPD